MFTSRRAFRTALVVVAVLLFCSVHARAQVTTGTLYGTVQDSSGGVLPGVSVVVTHEGTNLVREAVSDARGEFALPALPAGSYAVKLALAGFKTQENKGLTLGAGQTVRQKYTLDVGQMSESVTVVESAPLVQSASTAQVQVMGAEVTQIPIPRRNLQNVVMLASGVSSADSQGGNGRNFRVNGVGDGGSAITVDGTNAQTNPENRGMGQWGGQAQIEIMSIEAVSEVQIVKGVVPAEYGGAVGGHVNMITRSGTNTYHGSALESFQNTTLVARNPFLLPSISKPSTSFNQFGGSVGGPIKRDKVLFFATYEGYRENSGSTQSNTVPTQAARDLILAALPFPETKAALDGMPMPNVAVDPMYGRIVMARPRIRSDDTFMGKVDFQMGTGRLSVTATRMRPYAVNPLAEIGNDQLFHNASDRISVQHVQTFAKWVSESRFGWNHVSLARQQEFWFVPGTRGEQTELGNPRKRVGNIGISGLWTSPSSEVLDMKSTVYNVDQKLTRVAGAHTVKGGFRFYREYDYKSNPQTNQFKFSSLNDMLANKGVSLRLALGQPPHTAHMDQTGVFIQDDWHVTRSLVLNLGLRYDYYSAISFKATSSAPAEIVNLENPTDLSKMNFGPPTDPLHPTGPDSVFGPRGGFAWTLGESGATVVRGGVGIFSTSPVLAAQQNAIANPYIPVRKDWNATEMASKKLVWPMYSEDAEAVAIADAAGNKQYYYLIQTDLKSPRAVTATLDVQQQIGQRGMVSATYVYNRGRSFPMIRTFAMAFDRETGARPNPAVVPGGWYITSNGYIDYNALEANGRLRAFYGLDLSVHYTLAKGWAQQGGDMNSNFSTTPGNYQNTQDFFNPDIDVDRTLVSSGNRHRLIATAVWDIPWLAHRTDMLGVLLGGWQISSVVNIRSGDPLRLSQSSGMPQSRPDYNGGNQVFSNWHDTLLYLDRSAYPLVPTYAATKATQRPGTQNASQVFGPSRSRLDMTAAKWFKLSKGMRVQARFEVFNVFNWTLYNNPNTSITSADFGKITSSTGERAATIGVRFEF